MDVKVMSEAVRTRGPFLAVATDYTRPVAILRWDGILEIYDAKYMLDHRSILEQMLHGASEQQWKLAEQAKKKEEEVI